MNSDIKLNKVTEVWNIGHSEQIFMDADLFTEMHLYARYDGPISYSIREKSDLKVTQTGSSSKSVKHKI